MSGMKLDARKPVDPGTAAAAESVLARHGNLKTQHEAHAAALDGSGGFELRDSSTAPTPELRKRLSGKLDASMAPPDAAADRRGTFNKLNEAYAAAMDGPGGFEMHDRSTTPSPGLMKRLSSLSLTPGAAPSGASFSGLDELSRKVQLPRVSSSK